MLQPEIKKRLVLIGVVVVALILGIVQLFMTVKVEGAGNKLQSFLGGWKEGVVNK